MGKVEYLREQAAKAERFARMAFDSVTTERLEQAARDYLLQAEQLAAGPAPAHRPIIELTASHL